MSVRHEFHLDAPWTWAPVLLAGFLLVVVGPNSWNTPLFVAIHQAGWAVPGAVWQSVTFLGDAAPALVVALILGRRYPQLAWAALVAAIIGSAITHSLKPLFDAARPPAALDPDLLHIVGPALKRHAFPSGHSLTAFTVAGLIVFTVQQPLIRVAAIAAASLVAASRIFVGVHWPLDVVGGALGGWLAAWSGVLVAQRWPWGLTRPGRITVLALLLIPCAYLLVHDGGYPQARWLALLLAAAGFVSAILIARDLWHTPSSTSMT